MIQSRLTLIAGLSGLLMFGGMGYGATLAATYAFNGNLNAQQGGVAPLTAVNPASTSFVTDTVYGASRTVFNFDGSASPASSQAGLTFDDSSNLVSPTSYSIEMVFDLTAVSGYRRLVDTQDRMSDNGLYSLNGDIDLYNSDSGSTAMTANTYYDLIYTDDGTTVNAYLNGALQFTDPDSQLNLNNSNNPGQLIDLFLDNDVGGAQNEYSTGNIALFEVFNGVLSSNDVTTLASAPFANVGSSTATPEPSSWMLFAGGWALFLAGAQRMRH